MADQIYFSFDGSSLIAQVRHLQRAQPAFKDHKLDVNTLITRLTHSFLMRDIMGTGFRRATLYFAKGDDDQVERYLTLPDFAKPHSVRDIEVRYCGVKLPRSKKFDAFVEKKVPDEFQDRFQKSEKGVDIEICCDALQLAATGHLERLFLLTNDSDFIPLCRKLKELGSNVSLLRLSDTRPVNIDLAQACDSYDVFPLHDVYTSFGLQPPENLPPF
ncbi:MAG TPA: NYN domain-containing protein [Terriglobales bacterium]|nr:NYN domain-containing protein [Terriglobales bacterium]